MNIKGLKIEKGVAILAGVATLCGGVLGAYASYIRLDDRVESIDTLGGKFTRESDIQHNKTEEILAVSQARIMFILESTDKRLTKLEDIQYAHQGNAH